MDHNFTATRIRPLSEDIWTEIIESAGGRRAYKNDDQQTARNADYILGEAVIELKILEDESLSKTERQKKLAHLFDELDTDRPVHVLDRNRLSSEQQRVYDRAMEGPIKNAVKSAKKQLAQTRSDFPETKRSVLLLVNNSNTALDHDEIIELVSRRVRNDTEKIDGVVVAGAYLHSDGFDTFALWPINYVPIHLDNSFLEYKALRTAFHGHAERAMTEVIVSGKSEELTKGPMLDTGFDFDGKTFVKPAPPLCNISDFYINGRPRQNSTGIETSPVVGVAFPDINRNDWKRFRECMPDDPTLDNSFENWLEERELAISEQTQLKPLVPMTVTFDDWVQGYDNHASPTNFRSVCHYAHSLYEKTIQSVIRNARDLSNSNIIPTRYMLAETEIIGQDQANDVSHIYLVEEKLNGETRTESLVKNARIFHEHACTLAASYAVKHGVSLLRWRKIETYAWS
jgi:hypothetical protein